MESEACRYCGMSGAHSAECPTQFKASQQETSQKENVADSQENGEESLRKLKEDLMRYYVSESEKMGLEKGIFVPKIVDNYVVAHNISEADKQRLLRGLDNIDAESQFSENAYDFVKKEERNKTIAKENPDEKKWRLVKEVRSLDELKKVLADDIGLIHGAFEDTESTTPTELAVIIEKAFRGDIPVEALTDLYDLREKVRELRDKHFEFEVERVSDFKDLYAILRSMEKSGAIPVSHHKLLGIIGMLRKGERLHGEDLDAFEKLPRYVFHKVNDLLKGEHKNKKVTKRNV